MKKTLITLLALLLALAFAGCSNTAATTTTTAVETTAAAQEEEKEIFYYGEISYGASDEEALYNLSMEVYGDVEVTADTTNSQYHFKLYDDMNSALLALQKGDIVGLFLARNVAEYIAAQNPDQFAADEYTTDSTLAFAMALKSDNTALKDELNAAIAALEKDGTLEALEKEYLSDLSVLPEAKDIPTIDGAETIRVVVTGDMPPFDYVTADGKAAGYNVALLTAISEKINKNIELVYANAGSRYIQLTSGKADVVFWARGEKYSETAEFDFANDLPEGMAVTDSYMTEEWRYVRLK